MHKLLLASAAALVIATPAMAQDAHGYVGIDAGALFPKSQSVFGNVDFTNTANSDIGRTRVAKVKSKTGYDVGLIGGYDFGMFRLEGELGYKRSKLKSISLDNTFVTGVNTGAGTTFTQDTDFGISNHTSVYSAMLNGLVDFGGNGGIGGYVGGGAGYASVHQFGDSKGKFAWQLLAGVYAPVSSNIDVGLKYRYFRAGANDASVSYPFAAAGTTCGALPCSGGVATFDNDSRFTSHSLMLSLAYNFGGAEMAPPPPPPPPPPAPMAPATQTCPDGSVILATSSCPLPPPPPPPPAPVERGERGR